MQVPWVDDVMEFDLSPVMPVWSVQFVAGSQSNHALVLTVAGATVRFKTEIVNGHFREHSCMTEVVWCSARDSDMEARLQVFMCAHSMLAGQLHE